MSPDVPLAALCASVAGALHSMIDFSLQITGYAVVIAALLGAGLSQSFRSGSARDGRVTAGMAS